MKTREGKMSRKEAKNLNKNHGRVKKYGKVERNYIKKAGITRKHGSKNENQKTKITNKK